MEQHIRFESRDLKLYAEPVPVDELAIGDTYFSVSFLDNEMRIPELQPLVFLGRDLVPGDTQELYFQDAASYRRGARFGLAADDDPMFVQIAESHGSRVYDYERALDILMSCSLRRRGLRAAM